MASIAFSPNETVYGRSMPGFQVVGVAVVISILPIKRDELGFSRVDFESANSLNVMTHGASPSYTPCDHRRVCAKDAKEHND